jgi:aspartate/methionine/tyrosine aminotransferase
MDSKTNDSNEIAARAIDNHTMNWLQYGDDPGDFGFRQRLGVWLTKQYKAPTTIQATNLFITNGVSQVFASI